MLLPLHCYDEAGRVKPPLWLYWFLLLLCADWVALIFSLLTFGQTSSLLTILYPDRTVLGARLLATCPFVICLLLLGNRERLWRKNRVVWRVVIVPLVLLGVAASVVAQVQTMMHENWDFHWTPASFLLLNLIVLVSVLKSKHIKHMIFDWRYREDDNAQSHASSLTEDDGTKPARSTMPR